MQKMLSDDDDVGASEDLAQWVIVSGYLQVPSSHHSNVAEA